MKAPTSYDHRLFTKILRAHKRAAARKNAEFYNLGWVADWVGICSKTSEGILTTNWVAEGKYTHKWQPF